MHSQPAVGEMAIFRRKPGWTPLLRMVQHTESFIRPNQNPHSSTLRPVHGAPIDLACWTDVASARKSKGASPSWMQASPRLRGEAVSLRPEASLDLLLF